MSNNERDLIVGGQAVIEGVMMRTPNAYAIAVRKTDGTIVNTAAKLPKWSDKAPILKLPILRGGALLFIAAPLLLTNAIFVAAGWAPTGVTSSVTPKQDIATDAGEPPAEMPALRRAWNSVRGYLHPVRPTVGFNLIDGLIRMSFFLIMLTSFSLLKDIRRVFEYHGAEHKTVFTWEKGLALTVDNARPQPRQHPRCGTSFLMLVMLVSILLFSVIKFDSLLLYFLVRIALIPVVAGLSFEIIILSAKKES